MFSCFDTLTYLCTISKHGRHSNLFELINIKLIKDHVMSQAYQGDLYLV